MPNKYELYEKSVQSPDLHVDFFSSVYREVYERSPHRLREDFCGTFKTSCAWVKRDPKNKALSLDLDPLPLDYGRRKHFARLSADQRKRLIIRQADVLIPTSLKSDLIAACNFSFYIFKKRELLLKYFKSCLKSLTSEGLLILEMAGGPGMIATAREQKSVSRSQSEKFLYIWDQKSFDPISHDAYYAIHFKLPNGKLIKNAFTYDWRLWTIPEVRDLLEEAGFGKTYVYWETSFKGKGTGEFVRSEKGENDFAWIAYVTAVTRP